MSFEIIPLIHEHLFYLNQWGVITIDDLHEQDRQFVAIMEATHQNTIHVISTFDLDMPISESAITGLAKLQWVNHCRAGWNLIISPENPFPELGIATASQILSARLLHFESISEALKFIQHVDFTLANLSVKQISYLIRSATSSKTAQFNKQTWQYLYFKD